MPDSRAVPSLRPAVPSDVEVVPAWARSAGETKMWCSSDTHPVTAEQMLGWWADEDVRPWVMTVDAAPVGYGELWLDADEDEVELARLIVAPDHRGRGIGRSLVRLLADRAARAGLATTMLRVVPENTAAIASYVASGFVRMSPGDTAVFNEGQPHEYVWMHLPRPD